MKRILLAFTLGVFVLSANSQTLELSYGSHATLLNYGDTVTIDSLSTVSEMVATLNVKNTDTVSRIVFCRKQYINIVANTTNTFCWAGSCYPANVFLSLSADTIGPGETNPLFSAHYEPNLNAGTSIIKYTFSVSHGDSAWVYIKYTSTVGINDNELSYTISNPYPNPSNSNVYIDYDIPVGSEAVLQVYNICGKIEKEFVLKENNGILNINVSDLSAGVYLYSLYINGRTERTNRFIVTR